MQDHIKTCPYCKKGKPRMLDPKHSNKMCYDEACELEHIRYQEQFTRAGVKQTVLREGDIAYFSIEEVERNEK